MTGAAGRQALERFLRTEPEDAGCSHTMDLLHAYAELMASGIDPEARYPGVTAHLRSCLPCADDLDGLLAILGGL
jgi:hypothetical protein